MKWFYVLPFLFFGAETAFSQDKGDFFFFETYKYDILSYDFESSKPGGISDIFRVFYDTAPKDSIPDIEAHFRIKSFDRETNHLEFVPFAFKVRKDIDHDRLPDYILEDSDLNGTLDKKEERPKDFGKKRGGLLQKT